ncbi:MAG: protein translocase subunit SecF [Nitrospinota bacterium]
MRIFSSEANYDFVGKRRLCFFLSAAVILVGLVSWLVRGGLNYGIDFAGGTLVQVRFEREVPVGTIRRALGGLALGDTLVQNFGDPREVLIRVERTAETLEGLAAKIKEALSRHIGTPFEVRRTEAVGPQVGKDLRRKALLSVFYAMIGIVIYITLRFQFKYAVAAIIALIHDVLITIGVFSLVDKEFSLPIVAALLAIIGYSLNDTIVVFDRIRENTRLIRRTSLESIINTSINHTLSRTILTSGTTLLAVGAFYALGSEVIRDFAFALLVGIVVGTYSSIYIASPILIAWPGAAQTTKRKRRA